MTSQMATCSAAIAVSRVSPTAPSLAQPSVWISGWNVPTSQAARISASESSREDRPLRARARLDALREVDAVAEAADAVERAAETRRVATLPWPATRHGLAERPAVDVERGAARRRRRPARQRRGNAIRCSGAGGASSGAGGATAVPRETRGSRAPARTLQTRSGDARSVAGGCARPPGSDAAHRLPADTRAMMAPRSRAREAGAGDARGRNGARDQQPDHLRARQPARARRELRGDRRDPGAATGASCALLAGESAPTRIDDLEAKLREAGGLELVDELAQRRRPTARARIRDLMRDLLSVSRSAQPASRARAARSGARADPAPGRAAARGARRARARLRRDAARSRATRRSSARCS